MRPVVDDRAKRKTRNLVVPLHFPDFVYFASGCCQAPLVGPCDQARRPTLSRLDTRSADPKVGSQTPDVQEWPLKTIDPRNPSWTRSPMTCSWESTST